MLNGVVLKYTCDKCGNSATIEDYTIFDWPKATCAKCKTPVEGKIVKHL